MSTFDEDKKINLYSIACDLSKGKVGINPTYITFSRECENNFLQRKNNSLNDPPKSDEVDVNYLILVIERMIEKGMYSTKLHFFISEKSFKNLKKHLKSTCFFYKNIGFVTKLITPFKLVTEIIIDYF